jgi:hypothetical protein
MTNEANGNIQDLDQTETASNGVSDELRLSLSLFLLVRPYGDYPADRQIRVHQTSRNMNYRCGTSTKYTGTKN